MIYFHSFSGLTRRRKLLKLFPPAAPRAALPPPRIFAERVAASTAHRLAHARTDSTVAVLPKRQRGSRLLPYVGTHERRDCPQKPQAVTPHRPRQKSSLLSYGFIPVYRDTGTYVTTCANVKYFRCWYKRLVPRDSPHIKT